jgi:predicted NAD-dependent protein-ADP-ribosyltransferase YbiA (DUF1768 family)
LFAIYNWCRVLKSNCTRCVYQTIMVRSLRIRSRSTSRKIPPEWWNIRFIISFNDHAHKICSRSCLRINYSNTWENELVRETSRFELWGHLGEDQKQFLPSYCNEVWM